MPKRLTMKELIELTKIVPCVECGLQHAAIRTCDEARLEVEAQLDEVYRNDAARIYGRCDTCGEPCDEGGCTLDSEHETAKP
jgi:hypothetical protein